MSVYARYKKNPDGLRQLVELLESTPKVKRDKMIEVGTQEDREYTERAMRYMITFPDLIALPEEELIELLCEAPPRHIGVAISVAEESVKTRFLQTARARPQIMAEIKATLEASAVSPAEIGRAQMKLVEVARKLEKKGVIRLKKIPTN